jgi:hypothetical protein
MITNQGISSTHDIRELSADETDSVSGGNPLVGAALFLGAYFATKTLDAQSEGDGWIEQAKKYAEQKKGKQTQ